MSVAELIAILQQHNPHATVKILDSEWGYIDITEVFASDSGDARVNIA